MTRRFRTSIACAVIPSLGLVGLTLLPGCSESPSQPTPPPTPARTTAQGAPLSSATTPEKSAADSPQAPATPTQASDPAPAASAAAAAPPKAKAKDEAAASAAPTTPVATTSEKPTLGGAPVTPRDSAPASTDPAQPRDRGGIRPPGAADPAPRPDRESVLTVKPVPLDPTKPVGTPDADKPEFLHVSFNELASYEYDPFDAVEELNRKGEPSATSTGKTDGPKPISTQIPEKIRELNGKKLTVQGFMIPLEVRRNEVKSFLLVRNTMVCCFGAAASFNEWVYVQLDEGKTTKFTPDVLVSAYGVFDLGEDVQDGMVMSIYRLKAGEVALKSGF